MRSISVHQRSAGPSSVFFFFFCFFFFFFFFFFFCPFFFFFFFFFFCFFFFFFFLFFFFFFFFFFFLFFFSLRHVAPVGRAGAPPPPQGPVHHIWGADRIHYVRYGQWNPPLSFVHTVGRDRCANFFVSARCRIRSLRRGAPSGDPSSTTAQGSGTINAKAASLSFGQHLGAARNRVYVYIRLEWDLKQAGCCRTFAWGCHQRWAVSV